MLLNLFTLFYYVFLAVLVFVATLRLSLVGASGGYSLDSVLRLLIAVASLTTELRLYGMTRVHGCSAWAQ